MTLESLEDVPRHSDDQREGKGAAIALLKDEADKSPDVAAEEAAIAYHWRSASAGGVRRVELGGYPVVPKRTESLQEVRQIKCAMSPAEEIRLELVDESAEEPRTEFNDEPCR